MSEVHDTLPAGMPPLVQRVLVRASGFLFVLSLLIGGLLARTADRLDQDSPPVLWAIIAGLAIVAAVGFFARKFRPRLPDASVVADTSGLKVGERSFSPAEIHQLRYHHSKGMLEVRARLGRVLQLIYCDHPTAIDILDATRISNDRDIRTFVLPPPFSKSTWTMAVWTVLVMLAFSVAAIGAVIWGWPTALLGMLCVVGLFLLIIVGARLRVNDDCLVYTFWRGSWTLPNDRVTSVRRRDAWLLIETVDGDTRSVAAWGVSDIRYQPGLRDTRAALIAFIELVTREGDEPDRK